MQRYNLFAIYFAIYGKRCNFERHKSIPMMANMNLIRERVEMLREWMGCQETALWALVIPTMDPHDSEYVAGHWQMREWLTGFTGSAGTAVVTQDDALLWTDSRYWLQAEEQLAGTPFRLMREGVDEDFRSWLNGQEVKAGRIGYFEDMMSRPLYEDLFADSESNMLIHLSSEALNPLWTDRPPMPHTQVELMPDALVGETAAQRIGRLLEYLEQNGAEQIFLSDLSEICWLLNIRASDIPFNPYPLCFLMINVQGSHTLFIDRSRVPDEVGEQLQRLNIRMDSYANGLVLRCSTLQKAEETEDPIPFWRAIKNEKEQEGFRQSHMLDGVAMVRFLSRLESERVQGLRNSIWTELSVARLLEDLRRESKEFLDLSFETISAYGPHAATVHYEPTAETDVPLVPAPGQMGGDLLLLDSGAHYTFGTTDITRTICMGTPTEEERRVYTLVLRGHLKLMNMHFPEGTNGLQLDTAARMDMWRKGYDFGHGTGHGVGFRSGVHEGPLQIRKDKRYCTSLPFRAGQIVTDEPGIYLAGRFGVRIENQLLCQEAEQTEFGRFLFFECLTLCPYDRRLIDLSLLQAEEREWLNQYHRHVCEALLPLLSNEADRQWLQKTTEPI